MRKRYVVALGGNAIKNKGEKGTFEEQYSNVYKTMKNLFPLYSKEENEVIISHGNGPQVGALLIQNAAGNDQVPAMPMFVCGAMSQGQIGFFIQQAIKNILLKNEASREVLTVITQVEVDPKDEAFKNPRKPVGPFYSKEEGKKIAKETGYTIIEDAGRGYRRVVPSPKPIDVVELKAIEKSISAGNITISIGGGGIPVIRKDGEYKGVDAVIDKDRASALLADRLNSDVLIILTAVDKVCLNFGKDNEEQLDKMTIKDAKKFLGEEHFAPGSMKPKVEAVVQFVSKDPDRKALITSPDKLEEAMQGKNGTWISFK